MPPALFALVVLGDRVSLFVQASLDQNPSLKLPTISEMTDACHHARFSFLSFPLLLFFFFFLLKWSLSNFFAQAGLQL
jgi:hypothetical protein